ncbi:phage portal protein [Candidatus Enterococcus ferrettii]|uniref:SPP1 family phage portal protein n=1 Tax=Candidatus Enterococcus ferrettii TaxID=2815324 RepID=A0ABV0ELH0_9ENTE
MKDKIIELLDGSRFDDEANKIYKAPVSKLPTIGMYDKKTEMTIEEIDFEHEDVWEMIVGFIQHHQTHQVPRLEELRRYAEADNNINYRKAKPQGRADNRIASDFANFIVTFKKGVLLGNPLKYSGDKTISDKVNEFAKESNEDYHNQLMAEDLFTYGRAYEWVGRDEFGKETLTKLDVKETFIIYDTSKARNSLCAVNYYNIEYLGETTTHIDVYANDGTNYYRECQNQNYKEAKVVDQQPSYFNTVQINEWINNEKRLSDFEAVLDRIDAYDLSQSEMANFQQDLSEAMLVIKGNPDTFKKEDGSLDTKGLDYTIKNRIMILGDKKTYDDNQTGSEPDASYLVKKYDTTGVEAYNDRLVADILRFTALIDFTDENIGSNQSGIGFRFKGWGSDNDRKNKERMIKKAIMRRLRLLTYSWSIKEDINRPKGLIDVVKSIFVPSTNKQQESLYDKANDVEILFTPNVPQSDEEIMKVITGMAGLVSDETICEMASRLTGVSAEEELKRIKKEAKPLDLFDQDKNDEEEAKEELNKEVEVDEPKGIH